ncbi:MAG: hypothetical protein P8J89_03925 [Phycisphaerales bacterium]|nr:hypothetical protein [Phycisphaerales bacterium]
MTDSLHSIKFRCGLAVLMTALSFAMGLILPSVDSTVEAAPRQYPPYFQKLEKGLFYPSYLGRDSALITKQLGLSDEERVLVEAVIESYVETFEREAQAVREQLAQLESPILMELPDHVSRQDIRKRARQQMVSGTGMMGADGVKMEKSSVRQARTLKIIAEEMELEAIEELADSSRTQLIMEWSLRRIELEQELLQKLDLIRAENSTHWDAIRRALRRLNSDWGETFRCEEADLELLMREHFGQDDSNYMNARGLLAEYAIDYDMQLAIRNAVLSETTPILLDAIDRTHVQQSLALARDQVTARAALVDVNLAWMGRLLDSVEDERRREDFARYLRTRLFPNVHLGDPPATTIDYLVNSRLVDPETEKSLLLMKESYKQERDAWRTVIIAIKPEWERDRLMQELENNILSMAYTGWLNGLGQKRPILSSYKTHLIAGREINKDYFDQIRNIIGYEALSAVPGRFRVSRRSDSSRGPVPGARQSANVVYWDGFMNKIQ